MSWCDRTIFGEGYDLDSCIDSGMGADLAVYVRLGNNSDEGELQLTGRDRIRSIGEQLVKLADTHKLPEDS